MNDLIEGAKSDFVNAKGRLVHALATTPDERLNWSPSPTARTAIQQVAHAAIAIKNLNDTLDGRTFKADSVEAADAGFRSEERRFTTREEVLELLETYSAAYVAWLDRLTPDRLESMVTLPFDLGQAPLKECLAFPPMHTMVHAGQIQYMQTIYGDHDWHM
jgi:hypothetical protein